MKNKSIEYKDLTIFACELNGGLVSVEAQDTASLGLSGQMIWRKGCIESVNGKCIASQQWIEAECLCAINYNKIKREKNE